MPAAIVGAGIGAVGSAVGGAASGKGAAKAASIQAAATDRQTQLAKSIYDTNSANFQSDISNGNAAAARENQLLGLSGGDGANVEQVLSSTPGYQYAVQQGLAATNANAYASGLGLSGATLKALQTRGNNLADQNFNTYLGQVDNVSQRGVAAKSALAGVGSNYVAQSNAATQSGADASSTAALYSGSNIADVLKGLTSSAGSALTSSYNTNSTSNQNAIASAGVNAGVKYDLDNDIFKNWSPSSGY